MNQTQKELNANLSDEVRDERYEKRIFVIQVINWGSLMLLIIGISFILIFASVNSTNYHKNQNQNTDTLKVQIVNLNQLPMSQEEKKTTIVSPKQPIQNPIPNIEKKGATVPRQNTSVPKPVIQPATPPQTKK
jgi:cytoskeletal protein RodZ